MWMSGAGSVFVALLLHLSGVNMEWSVTYNQSQICALTNTSVEMFSRYSYPSHVDGVALRVTKTFWFTTWRETYRDPIDIAFDPNYNGRVEYDGTTKNHHKLILKNLTKEDSAVYKFSVETNVPKEKVWGPPGVTLTITALTVTVTPAATVTEGERVTLNCATSCPLSDPIYIWYQNNRFLNQSQHSVTLDPVSSQDAGMYSCAVKDQENSHVSSPEITLNVTYHPRTPLVSVSPYGEIEEGSAVNLTCSSDANPPVNEYVWYKKNYTSPKSLGQNYVMMNISLEDAGEYYCTATNDLGTSTSTTIQLTVTRKTLAANPPSNVVGEVINAFRLFLVLLVSLLLLIYVGISMKKCLMSVTEPSNPVQHGQSVSDPEYENVSATRVRPSTAEQTQTTKTQEEVHCATVHFSHATAQEGPTAFIQM